MDGELATYIVAEWIKNTLVFLRTLSRAGRKTGTICIHIDLFEQYGVINQYLSTLGRVVLTGEVGDDFDVDFFVNLWEKDLLTEWDMMMMVRWWVKVGWIEGWRKQISSFINSVLG